MVRAGVVKHPSQQLFGGYNEICQPEQRYSLINRHELMNIPGMENDLKLSAYHAQWVEAGMKSESNSRESIWTESVAVGN